MPLDQILLLSAGILGSALTTNYFNRKSFEQKYGERLAAIETKAASAVEVNAKLASLETLISEGNKNTQRILDSHERILDTLAQHSTAIGVLAATKLDK